MNTTSLVAEFLIIGTLPFLTILFSILATFKIYDTTSLGNLKDFVAIILAGVTIVIYLLGALTHRLIDTISANFLRPIILKTLPRMLSSPARAIDAKTANRDVVLIYQYGSENLIKRYEYTRSLFRIFKATLLTVPFLGTALSIWLYSAVSREAAITSIVIAVMIFIMAIISYINQRTNNILMDNAAISLLKKYSTPKDK